MKSNKKNGKTWKKIAIAGIIIFLVILLLTVIKLIKRPQFSLLLDNQKEKAFAIIRDVSNREGYNLSDYNIRFNNRIDEINIDNQKKHILRVALENKNNSRQYLIDTDDWVIVLSSKTEYYKWMINNKPPHPIEGRWFHNELWNRKR